MHKYRLIKKYRRKFSTLFTPDNQRADNYHVSLFMRILSRKLSVQLNPFTERSSMAMDRSSRWRGIRRNVPNFSTCFRRSYIHSLRYSGELDQRESNFRIFFNGTRATCFRQAQVAPIVLSASNWPFLFLLFSPVVCGFPFFPCVSAVVLLVASSVRPDRLVK